MTLYVLIAQGHQISLAVAQSAQPCAHSWRRNPNHLVYAETKKSPRNKEARAGQQNFHWQTSGDFCRFFMKFEVDVYFTTATGI